VTLRGFSSFVKRLTPSDIDVHIDLSNVVKGTNSFIIAPDDITVPVGATVIQISPSTVEVLLDMTVYRTVAIEPIIRGDPADGYVLEEVTVEPKSLKIAGAQSIVKTVSKVETEVVTLSNVTEDLIKKVKVKLLNPSLRLEKEEERVVTVSAKIVPEMTSRFFEEIPLLVEDETRAFTLSPDSITALVHGPKLQLRQMTPTDIPAVVETASLPEGQSVVQVNFRLPERMSVKIYYPKIITINILGSQ
jgi:YbbR domain-containing protein